MVTKRTIYQKLRKIQKILNEYHSQIPQVEIGRQNVLNDINNQVGFDKLIKNIKEDLKNGN